MSEPEPDNITVSMTELRDVTQSPLNDQSIAGSSTVGAESTDRIRTAMNMIDYLPYLQKALLPSSQESVERPINSLIRDVRGLQGDPGASKETAEWASYCDHIISILLENGHIPSRHLTLLPAALKGVLSAGTMTDVTRELVWDWRDACVADHTQLYKMGGKSTWVQEDGSDSGNESDVEATTSGAADP